MLGLIPRLPLYWAFRAFGWPAVKPFSVVVSVSFRCNSKCRTCDVWRRPNDDLTLEEWDKVFASLGRAPFYMTFTGGEPFLRADLDDLVIAAYRHCRPEVITIPTNGMLTERVVEKVARMCRECPQSSIGINLSLDGLEDEHDDIRGVEGNWKLAMETWRRLKELQQYRPAIFYHSEEQKRLAEESKAALEKSGRFNQPIVVEITAASTFTPAEDYHQDYYKKNPIQYFIYRHGCGRDARLEALWGKAKTN